MSFKKIKDQPLVAAALKNALEKERLPHGLLFQGPVNSGQHEMAMELAKAVFCENKKGFESCDSCYHCRQIDQNTHPDFFTFGLEEDARDIKVEAIRDLIARANLKPFSASAKVFVIDPAERMNDVAQNAFLKILEEPMGRTIFVLISSSPQQLLPTIRSRVQTLHFTPVTQMEEKDPEKEKLQKGVVEYVFYHADQPLKSPDISKLKREDLSKIFDRLVNFHRDLLLLKVDAEEIIGNEEGLLEKKKLAKDFSEEEIMQRIELFGDAKEKVSENLNVKLVLSSLWESLASGVSARK